MFEEEEYEEKWEFRRTMGGNRDANRCVVQLMQYFFFSLLDTTLVFFYLWLARRLQLTRSHVLLAVHSPSGGVPNGTSEIHAQDDL